MGSWGEDVRGKKKKEAERSIKDEERCRKKEERRREERDETLEPVETNLNRSRKSHTKSNEIKYPTKTQPKPNQIGRASCRERV